MEQKIIRFCYRKIIDSSSQKIWDKYVFDSTYTEFLMQAQFYNQQKKYKTFAALIQHVPNAEKLHFLVSASITGYLKQLNETVPDIVNNLGRQFLPFKNYNFEIINSDITNKNDHRVAVNFFSEPLIWHDTIGDYLLISDSKKDINENGRNTDMVKMQPFFGIYSLKAQAI